MTKKIIIRGARTHNLKNISIELPRDRLIVMTGLSGSGKSSLAFDTIYAEGQRRYVESLSAYARQFLNQMDKPDVDAIEGLSPAVSVEQKSQSHNPRSTVGTSTEINDYLRLLFARIGRPYCHQCERPIEKQNVSQIVSLLLSKHAERRVNILAPVIRERKGEHQKELERLKSQGFVRVRVDDRLYDLSDEVVSLDKKRKHNVDVVVDRLAINSNNRFRIAEALESAFVLADGIVKIDFLGASREPEQTQILSIKNACLHCGISYPKIEPQMFSFNSPLGACAHCDGLGELMFVDEGLVVPNENLSINQGAIVPWFGKKTNYYQSLLEAVAAQFRFSLNTPYKDLSHEVRSVLFDGSGEYIKIKAGKYSYDGFFEGIKSNLMRRYRETESDWMRAEITKFMSYQCCPQCEGKRLKKESLSIKINKISIGDVLAMSVEKAAGFFGSLDLASDEKLIAAPIVKEVRARLSFLLNVGLNYLSLDRKSHSLSGGESQRIKLATQIGSALVGVTYVLDEPSVGLHQRDNKRLISTLEGLRDIGNTVIVVEHDEEAIRCADYIVDLGPGAGVHGGEIVYAGDFKGLKGAKRSLTSDYFTGKRKIDIPDKRRVGKGITLQLLGAHENNLKKINVGFPLGKFICVTGVSGSGKSTLVNHTLFPALMQRIYKSKVKIGGFKAITNTEGIDKVISIDQSPIGRTPRSNPATYTGLFTHIRDLFSELPESKARGYQPGRFSFNVKGGRCPACEGDGVMRIEMHFLPDVYVKCETCQGRRFNEETLSVFFKGKNISDCLNMKIEEALVFFDHIPAIKKKCETLFKVGLGYIELGQFATTLSGGEAQRVKLSRELAKRPTGSTIYILDEPTTGLHYEDVKNLIRVLNELVDHGNTVIVIEHNLHVIKVADHVIDLGPEGGDNGGTILFEGPPEDLVRCKKSYTGKALLGMLK
ncbi:MAG: excinuclease ABC subunit UvrA [Deltaproteobacteria bacterium]|nr:excinuclease ABC subunit UvrA [Deltaproteobacteria bacterium]